MAAAVLPEDLVRDGIDLVVRITEAAGALVIFVGALVAFARAVVAMVRDRHGARFVAIRLELARFLVLGLEFQLASDVLRTAVAPTFEEIGRLAAIAVIRTGLSFVLAHEMREEREALSREGIETPS